MKNQEIRIIRLKCSDYPLLRQVNKLFEQAFEEAEIYANKLPCDKYLHNLLAKECFIVLVALCNKTVVGALTAYIFDKYEQERKEAYIYDLAVAINYRRKGIATSLIDKFRLIAVEGGAYVVVIQANYDNKAAIKLYSKYAKQEKVVHFEMKSLN